MRLARFSGIVMAAAGASTLAARAAFGAAPAPAVGVGALLAAGNAVAAYAMVRWSEGRSTRAFVRAILGGMTLRLLLLLAAVFVAVKLARLPVAPFLFSLLGHFVAFLALELLVVHRTLTPAAAR